MQQPSLFDNELIQTDNQQKQDNFKLRIDDYFATTFTRKLFNNILSNQKIKQGHSNANPSIRNHTAYQKINPSQENNLSLNRDTSREREFRGNSRESPLPNPAPLQPRGFNVESMEISNQTPTLHTGFNATSTTKRESTNETREILHTEFSPPIKLRWQLISELKLLSRSKLLNGIYQRNLERIRNILVQSLGKRGLSFNQEQSQLLNGIPRGDTHPRELEQGARTKELGARETSGEFKEQRESNAGGIARSEEIRTEEPRDLGESREQGLSQSSSRGGDTLLSQGDIREEGDRQISRDSNELPTTRTNNASKQPPRDNREKEQDFTSTKGEHSINPSNRFSNDSTTQQKESVLHQRQGGITTQEARSTGLDFSQGNLDISSNATPQTQETLFPQESNSTGLSEQGIGDSSTDSLFGKSLFHNGAMHSQASSNPQLENPSTRLGEQQNQQGDFGVNLQGIPSEPRELFKTLPKSLLLKRNFEAKSYDLPYPIITGIKARIEANLKALQTLSSIMAEGRNSASEEEQEILASYSGFGGLKDLFYDEKYQTLTKSLQDLVGEELYLKLKDSTLNAFYTPNPIIEAMFEGLKQAKVPMDNSYKIQVLEPSCGNGRFLSFAPKNFEWTCVELEPISATITKLLHPSAKVYNEALEDIEWIQEFDIIIGNPPYSDVRIQDYKSAGNSMLSSNYFAVKAQELLKENGIFSFIINSGFLDSKNNRHREILSENGVLLNAFRLPNSTFKETNTQVLSDILFYQKETKERIDKQKKSLEIKATLESFLNLDSTQIAEQSIELNNYFTLYPQRILGTLELASNQYGEQDLFVKETLNPQSLKQVISEAMSLNYSFGLNPPKIEKRLEIPQEAKADSLLVGNLFFYEERIYKKISKEHCELAYFEEELPLSALESIPKEDILEKKKDKFLYKKYLTNLEVKILQKVLEFRDLLKDNLANEQKMPNEERFNHYILEQKVRLRALREQILTLVKPKNRKLEDCYFANNFKATEQRHSFHSILKLESLDCYRIFACETIENLRENGKNVKKISLNSILKERVCYPLTKVLAKNAQESLQKTIIEKGVISLKTLQSYLPSVSIEKIVQELLDSKLVYPNFSLITEESLNPKDKNLLLLREEFLSGNVKDKYKKIQILIDQKTSLKSLGFLKDLINLRVIQEDLKASFPKDLEFESITLNFGASFIPSHIYAEFFKTYFVEPSEIELELYLHNGTYSISKAIKSNGDSLSFKDFKESGQEFRIQHLKFRDSGEEYYEGIWCEPIEFFNKVLANKSLEVFHYKEDPNDEKRKIKVSEIANTRKAIENAENLKFSFNEFLYANPKYCEEITQIYNETINVFAPKTLNYENFLQTPHLNQAITLRPHQKNAIFKGIMSNALMLDHQVGAGKTLACIAIAMEQKRMGLIHKALFLVPNHLSGQWGEEFLRAYPNAKILVGENIKSKKERKEFLHRARFGDYDAIIMKHSTFENLKVLESYQIEKIKEALLELGVLIDNKYRSKNMSKKQAEKLADKVFHRQKVHLERKLKSLLEGKTYDKEIAFEDLGIDALFVDEIQEFKNLYILHSQENVKGLPTLESQKASKMLVATSYMHERGYKVYLATGTPISNSIAEMFVMQQYLQPYTLRKLGLHFFDAWQRTFSKIVASEELDSTGVNFSIVHRLSQFINVPELLNLYQQNADIITNKEIKRLNNNQSFIPQLEGGKPKNIILPRSELVASYIGIEDERGEFNVGSLVYRAEHLRDDPIENNMLKILSDGAKASLDFRLLYPSAPDFEHSKVNACVKNILEIYHDSTYPKNTQLVFCDLGVSKIPSSKITLDSNLSQNEDSLLEIAKERNLFAHRTNEDSILYVQILNNQTNEIITSPREIKYQLDEQGNSTGEILLKDNQEIIKEYSAQDLLGFQSKFNVYGDILQKLVQKGIPQEQIAFIGDANTDTQKQKLFSKVNNGEIRILIGSTAKMGAGTNVQKRVVAMHELTCPYRPSDLEQRQGRVLRQGNLFFEEFGEAFKIKSFRYATESTLDARMYQINESKLKAINMLKENNLEGKREIEAIDEAQIAIAEMKAEATGNPFIIEKNRIALMLEKELAMYKAYQAKLLQEAKEIETIKQKIQVKNEDILALRELMNIKVENSFRFFDIEYKREALENKTQKEAREKAHNAIQRKLNDYIKSPENKKILADFTRFQLGFKTFFMLGDNGKHNLKGFLQINQKEYEVENLLYKGIDLHSTLSFEGLLKRLQNFFNEIPKILDNKSKELESLKENQKIKEHYLNTHKSENYERKPFIEILRKDKKNIDAINALIREYKKEKGIKLNEQSKELKPLLPQYKNYLNDKGKLEVELLKTEDKREQESKEQSLENRQSSMDNLEIVIPKESENIQELVLVEESEIKAEEMKSMDNPREIVNLPIQEVKDFDFINLERMKINIQKIDAQKSEEENLKIIQANTKNIIDYPRPKFKS